MGRIKRGGYLIEWWIGDHQPKHVHIFRNGKETAKVRLSDGLVLTGRLTRRLERILKKLVDEGRLK